MDKQEIRALYKRKYLMTIEDFSMKPYVVTSHQNRLVETVQMRGHIICFQPELTRAPQAGQNTPVAQKYSLTIWPLSGGG